MNGSERPTGQDRIDGDDAPDLSAPKWRKVIDAAPVTRPAEKRPAKGVDDDSA